MGGFGSGRYPKRGIRPKRKLTTFQLPRVKSSQVMNSKIAEKGSATYQIKLDGRIVRLEISPTDFAFYIPEIEKPFSQGKMDSIACANTDARRFLFVCPRCQKRCFFLYFVFYPACSDCLNLVHPTRNMSNEDRFLWKRDRFREKYSEYFQDGYLVRPKWVKKSFFERLEREWNALDFNANIVFLNKHNYPLAYQVVRDIRNEGKSKQDGKIQKEMVKLLHVLRR